MGDGAGLPAAKGRGGKKDKVVLPFLRHRGDSLVSLVVDLRLSGRRRCADCCLFYSVASGQRTAPTNPKEPNSSAAVGFTHRLARSRDLIKTSFQIHSRTYRRLVVFGAWIAGEEKASVLRGGEVGGLE